MLALNKIGGKARAMVVTGGIERAIQYYHAIRQYLLERKSRYQAIVAFSGEHEYGGVQVSESSLNGFPSGRIADKIQQDPYRFLICADKFQTGYMCLPSEDAITAALSFPRELGHETRALLGRREPSDDRRGKTARERRIGRSGVRYARNDDRQRRVSTDVGDNPAPDGAEVSSRVDDIELL